MTICPFLQQNICTCTRNVDKRSKIENTDTHVVFMIETSSAQTHNVINLLCSQQKSLYKNIQKGKSKRFNPAPVIGARGSRDFDNTADTSASDYLQKKI